MRTDKGIYKGGEPVKLSGKVVNLGSAAVSTVVAIQMWRRANPEAGEGELVYQQLLEPKDNEFSDAGYVVQFPNGDDAGWRDLLEARRIVFDVEAEVLFRETSESRSASQPHPEIVQRAGTTFSAEQLSVAGLLLVGLYPAVVVFALLTLAYSAFIGAADKKRLRWGMVLVYCVGLLSLVAAFMGPLLVSASPSTEALLRTTPVGIGRAALTEGGDVEWVLNLGGVLDANNSLTGGFGVPLFVLVLALIGGVMSMLLKLPAFLTSYDGIVASVEEAPAKVAQFRAELLHEFISIVSAPFIGLVAFSLASLADYTNHYALSVVAFGVGFVSDRIVDAVRGFAVRVLGAQPQGDEQPVDEEEDQEEEERNDSAKPQPAAAANGDRGKVLGTPAAGELAPETA